MPAKLDTLLLYLALDDYYELYSFILPTIDLVYVKTSYISDMLL